MISGTPEQQMFYDARLKALRDHEMHLRSARQQGLAEGREEGRRLGHEEGLLIGRIQIVQEIPGQSVSAADDLKDLLIPELKILEQRLTSELKKR